MTYAVVTFGCRVNQADSLGFEEELLAAGAVAASPQTADLVVVNSCSVTATADQGTRQTIRRIARDNPGARIVVTGCYATRRPDEVAALPSVSRVVLNDDKPRLIQFLKAETAEHAVPFAGDGPCGATIEPGVAGRTAFTLRVQTGCAEPCSYCIIPTTRGTPRSVGVEAVLSEVERVAAAGFKEIALTGVHLGSYGRDLAPAASLIDLLRALDGRSATPDTRSAAADTGSAPPDSHSATAATRSATADTGSAPPDSRSAPPDSRSATALAERSDLLFRISSLEPMDCSREVVDLVASSDRFAPHFHLPLQHASDRVLAAMRRPYTIAQYSSLVDHIRSRMPDASLGSDILVGFPGETDEDFEQLAGYLEGSPLTHVHVFPYSARPGTPASTMTGTVNGVVIRERGRRIRDIGQRLSARFHDAQVGTTHRALTLEDGTLAVTDNYLKVRIPPGRGRNEWVRLRLTSHHDGELLGR